MVATASSLYGSRPTKHHRTKAEIAALKESIYRLLEAEHPMTARQLFYAMVVRSIIGKSENEYKNVVVRLLGRMRRDGSLPFEWIADNSRWMRKPTTYNSLEQALEQFATAYRRDLWQLQPAYVEVWIEKDALAGTVYDITSGHDVPLMVSRGFSSITFLKSAADVIGWKGKPAYIYYFGDRDPSGVHIDRKIEEDLREFAPGAEIHFQRLAVTEQQIADLNLPTRPTKRTDSRARNWTGESIELDAIPPATLKALVRDCIERHIDRDALERHKETERIERESLHEFMSGLGVGLW